MKRVQVPQSEGYLHWALPVMLALSALAVLLSGRDLSKMFLDLQSDTGTGLHPAIAWAQRLVSLMLLLIAAERLLNHFVLRKHVPSPPLMWAFVIYWSGTVAVPALLGAHPQISHEYLYPLILGIAGLLATAPEREKVVAGARTALFLFLLASVALVPLNPILVLDTSYRQGLFPGVPRLGGIAIHPVALGMFAQIFLLCLWSRRFSNAWLNALAWLLGLGVLFFAQSKTSWVAFFLCSIVMLSVRHGPNVWRRIGDPRQGAFGILFCVGMIVFVGAVVGVLLIGNIESQASSFLDTAEGAQLMTMTGRDQIWGIALEEWHANPLFGYGPGLWDDAFRASIGMPQATSAHNQFMDTAARAGTIGAGALVCYALVLAVLSVRYAKATGGLSLALVIALTLRCITEVPLLLFGYGTEFFTHLLLLITLASAAAAHRKVVTAVPVRPTNYRIAS